MRTRFLFLALAIAFGTVAPTYALTVSPLRYEISGDPGEVLREEIKLVNETKQSQLYYISFANFQAQGDTGTPSFIEPVDDLGTWITTSQASVNLTPGEQKTVDFTIHIPKDAEPGGHFAAIFFGTSAPAGSGTVSIGTKITTLILLSVNGEVKESAGLVDFSLHNNDHFYKKLPVGFQYRFSNQGGDRVKPTGNVVIRSILGWRVAKVNANPNDGNVLPGTTRKFMPEWVKGDSVSIRDDEQARDESYSFIREVKSEWHNFAVGIFRARVVAEFGASDQIVKSKAVYFVVFPWELILLILVVGIPLWFFLRVLLRRYNQSIIRKAQLRFQRQDPL